MFHHLKNWFVTSSPTQQIYGYICLAVLYLYIVFIGMDVCNRLYTNVGNMKVGSYFHYAVEMYLYMILTLGMSLLQIGPSFQTYIYIFLSIIYGTWVFHIWLVERTHIEIHGYRYGIFRIRPTFLQSIFPSLSSTLSSTSSSTTTSSTTPPIVWLVYERDPSIIKLFECPDHNPHILSSYAKHVIKRLYAHSLKKETCPICYETIQTKQLIIQDCCHFLCKTCDQKVDTCPLCKK